MTVSIGGGVGGIRSSGIRSIAGETSNGVVRSHGGDGGGGVAVVSVATIVGGGSSGVAVVSVPGISIGLRGGFGVSGSLADGVVEGVSTIRSSGVDRRVRSKKIFIFKLLFII